MQNRWLLLGFVGALVALFAGSAVLLLRSLDRFPQAGIVVSPPIGWIPGETQELGVYIRTLDGERPLSDLPARFQIQGPRTGSPPLVEVPLVERRPGCYVARVNPPPGSPEGPYRARLFLPSHPEADLAAFDLRLSPPLALLVIPPKRPLYAGETGSFDVAGLDLSSARPVPNLLTRIRVTPPSGLEIVNRTLVTSSSGVGRFLLRQPTLAGVGDFHLHLSSGRIKTTLVFPFLPRTLASILPDHDQWIPANGLLKRILTLGPHSSDCPDLLWTDPPPMPPPAWGARVADQNLLVTFDQNLPAPHRLEIWLRNHLMASYALASAAGTLRLPFSGPLPQGLPIRIRIWTASGTSVLAEDMVLPPHQDESTGRSPVVRLAERLDLSPSELIRRLLATQSPKPLAFTVSLQDGLTADWLQKWAGAVLLVFPVCLVMLFGLLLVVSPRRPAPGSPETTRILWHGRMALTVAIVFLATVMVTGTTAHPLIGVLLGGWALILLHGFRAGHFQPHIRLGAGLLLALAYLGGLSGVDLLAVRAGLDPGLVWPDRPWIIGSFLAASLALLLMGVIHLPELFRPGPGGEGDAWSKRLPAFLLKGGWEGALGLTLALGAMFGGVFWASEEWDHRFPQPAAIRPAATAPPGGTLTAQFPPDLIFRQPGLPTSGGEPSSAGEALPLGNLEQLLRRRPSPSRFFLVRHRRRWTGRPIRRLEIILEARTFWDRVIDHLGAQPRTPLLVCQEARARCARFPQLDPDEQESEIPTLEAILGDLAHLLLDRIRLRQPLEPELKASLEEVFHRFSQLIYVDPTIKVHVRSAPTLGDSERDPTEAGGVALPFLESDSDQEILPLTPDQLEQCFQPGGELLLTGPRGTSVFQIQPETFTLTRGVSFRQDLDIESLELRRRHPLILRLGF